MAQLEKFIKVTQEQYNTLQAGGTVGSYTGIDPNFIYLVEGSSSSDGGTTVTPNPTLSGSETVLTGLTIDGTNYRMPEVTVDETYVSDALANFLADEIEPKLEDKQDTLVSGTNIKTINGTSILGSGNISIEGGSGSGTTVEANPTDDATDILNKLKVAGVTYSLPSGGSSEGGSLEPIVKTPVETDTGVTITFTEDELNQIQSNLGTVVNLNAGEDYIPLSPSYSRISMTTMQPQLILCCEMAEHGMWYKFEPTEDPLVFTLNTVDMSSPFGDGVNFSSIQIGNIMPQNGDSIDGASGTITEDQYNLLHATLSTGYADMYRCRPYLSEGPDEYPVVYFYPSNLYGYFGFAGTGEMYKLTFTTKNSDGTYNWSISHINNSSTPIYTYTGSLTSTSDFNNVVTGNYTHVYLEDTGYECPWIIVSKSDNSYICELTTGFMSPASTNTNGYDGACKTYIRFNYDSESNAVTYNYYNVYTSTVMGNPDEDHTNDVTKVSEPLETILINDKLYSVGGSSGTTVEANPNVEENVEVLTSVSIDNTNYTIPVGVDVTLENEDTLVVTEGTTGISQVMANPIDAPTAVLHTVTINNTVYEVPNVEHVSVGANEIVAGDEVGSLTGSGLTVDQIATKEYVDNKISVVLNEDATVNIIIN